ncbi:MAG: tRNA 2-selenouridine(34) synthase MnmH, partial [Dyadobacter sp.]
IDLIVDLNQRVVNLVKEYGQLDKEFLISCTERIHKRLGPVQTKNAIVAIKENRMEEFIRLVLVYYDKTYRTSLSKRPEDHILSMDIERLDPAANARQILNFSNTIPPTPVQ